MSDETIEELAKTRADLERSKRVILELTNNLTQAERMISTLQEENRLIRDFVNETSIFVFASAKILAAAVDAGFRIYDRFQRK